MPQNNYDHVPTPVDPEIADPKCPKCGAEMEPIDIDVEGLPLEQLQLCPDCYLVTWSDQDGLHVRQGVPMKPGAGPGNDKHEPGWVTGEPEQC
jgi:hypothetical protein